MSGIDLSARESLRRQVRGAQTRLIELARTLVQVPSENPPGDTSAVAEVAAEILRAIPDTEVSLHCAERPVVNLVARVRGAEPGRRLVFNGHLDTYPVGDAAAWSVDPLAGEVRDGRFYGRGMSDMKGGIACSLLAFALLAGCREAWSGETGAHLGRRRRDHGDLGHRLSAAQRASRPGRRDDLW